MTYLVDRKLAKWFEQIDIPGTGFISRDDLLTLGNQLLFAFSTGVGTPKGAALIDAIMAFWARITAETCTDACTQKDAKDHTAVFTEGEFAAITKNVFCDQRREYEQHLAPMLDAIVALCDHDDDGCIGREEFAAAQVVLGTHISEIAAAFRHLDTNDDGLISCEELADAARGFYASSKPSEPGNGLFGALI